MIECSFEFPIIENSDDLLLIMLKELDCLETTDSIMEILLWFYKNSSSGSKQERTSN